MSDSLLPQRQQMQQVRNTPLSSEAGPVKVSRQLREVFREAFDQLGGAAWLVEFASANDQNARVFVQCVSKLLPASAAPQDSEKVIIDIPWLTRDRLAYKDIENGPVDADVIRLLPKEKNGA